jgi:hypothetical protein
MPPLSKNEWNAFLKRASKYASERTNNAINKKQKADAAKMRQELRIWTNWGRRRGLNK